MFTDFRDIYLLSNPVGSKINKFYYKYTLYPAEVFKSLNQKMLKTGIIESQKVNITRMLENIFLNNDYIPIQHNIDADLKVVSTGDEFIFKNHDRPVLQISAKKFFNDSHSVIIEFEQKSDTWAFFRKITMFSLLSGFPLAVYVIVHGIISILFGFFFNLKTSSLIASVLCFVLCLGFIFSFQLNRTRNISESHIAEALRSDRWQDRVAALKFIDESGLEIKQFHTYPELLKSDYIAERYWVVRSLANSRNPGTYKDLLGFLNDTHPNVVSMALYGLGRRGNKEAISRIMQLIETTDDWYLQWYAYKAMRALGWRQTKLN
jgi:ABC-type multidrug transport system fused ATPase/permease subunit